MGNPDMTSDVESRFAKALRGGTSRGQWNLFGPVFWRRGRQQMHLAALLFTYCIA